jgi:hypothetical protein
MRTCLIFGAGATLANALHFHSERRTDRNPPLDGTFFNKIRALEVAVPTDLRRYASTLPTGSPFEASSGTVRMEEFFKDLFFDFVAEPNSKSQIAGAYTALIDIYRRVISDTTDWLIDPKRSGAPVGRLIAEIAKSSTGVTGLAKPPPVQISRRRAVPSRGVFANKKLRNVEVINPDPASAYRYAKLMPNIPLRWYPNISSFLRDHRLA